MKNRKLILFASALLVSGGSLFFLKSELPKVFNQYGEIAEEEEREKMGFAGAVEHSIKIRANKLTGKIEAADVLKAREEVNNFHNPSRAAYSLLWEEMGPDNVGGRTRAVLLDRSNPSIIYAGGVAGGLFKSTNGGLSWSKINDQLDNMAITCISQGTDGTVYVGTGEGHYYLLGTGAGGILGAGIFKLSPGASTLTQIPSTVPTIANNAGDTWGSIYKIATIGSSTLIVSTGDGLRVSNDAGATWNTPITASTKSHDVEAIGNTVYSVEYANSTYKVFKSTDGGTTFTDLGVGAGKLPSGAGRIEIAVAPTDANYVYASVSNTAGGLTGIYRTTDGGSSWSVIGPGNSTTFKPLGEQGTYANAISVCSTNKDKILVGGLDMWSWTAGGSWTQVTNWFYNPSDVRYLHADHHEIVWHPNGTTVYFGNDGGFGRSLDGGNTFQTLNKGYNVTQFYSLAYSPSGELMGGTQDNGTQFIDFKGITKQTAEKVNGGDGGHCEISYINPNAFFTTVYYGQVRRSSNRGSGFGDFFSKRIHALEVGGNAIGNPGFAGFVTPISLWESKNDPLSVDSVVFSAADMTHGLGLSSNNQKVFKGKIDHSVQPNAIIVPGSIKITAPGSGTIVDNGAGRFVKTNIDTNQVDTINYTTGDFQFAYKTGLTQGIPVTITYSVRYDANTVVYVKSKTNNTVFTYTLPTALNSGQSTKIQDVVQSKLIVGFNTSSGTSDRGIFMIKNPLDFSDTPEWIKIAGTKSKPSAFSGEPTIMVWGKTGDVLYVGTSGGGVYRISNLAAVADTNDAVDFMTGHSASSFTLATNAGTPIKCTQIGSFPQSVTGIAVDPQDDNNVILTLGNYGQTKYVYRSTNALTSTTSTGTFTSIQSNLPKMPVYTAVIDFQDNNKVVIGTEYGIWAADDAFTAAAASVTWSDVSNGTFPKVPVFMLRQQTRTWNEVGEANSGVIYAATHGRGFWKTSSLLSSKEKAESGNAVEQAKAKNTLKVFPNPATSEANVTFNLTSNSDVKVVVYDLQGKIVRTLDLKNRAMGENTVNIETSGMKSGTYFMNVSGQGFSSVAKFIVIN